MKSSIAIFTFDYQISFKLVRNHFSTPLRSFTILDSSFYVLLFILCSWFLDYFDCYKIFIEEFWFLFFRLFVFLGFPKNLAISFKLMFFIKNVRNFGVFFLFFLFSILFFLLSIFSAQFLSFLNYLNIFVVNLFELLQVIKILQCHFYFPSLLFKVFETFFWWFFFLKFFTIFFIFLWRWGIRDLFLLFFHQLFYLFLFSILWLLHF